MSSINLPEGGIIDDGALEQVLNDLKSDLQSQIDALQSQALGATFPVGMTYIQFPGEYEPSQLGWPGTWTNISTTFQGAFFRAEGGKSKAFEGGKQQGALKQHRHSVALTGTGTTDPAGNHRHPYSRGRQENDTRDGGNKGIENYHTQYTGYAGIHSHNFSVSVVGDTEYEGDDTENRPENYTVRIWKRTS